jgi:hypothetical protein
MVVGLTCVAGEAMAANNDGVFELVGNKLANLFFNIRKVLYVAGAFALVATAIGGIMGKVKWQLVAHLGAALFILVIATEVIVYATDGGEAADFKIGDFDSNYN